MMNDNGISHSPMITALGRYHVLRRIGRGGMGDVWLCEDPRLQRQVAIKTLPAHSQSDHEYALRFEREAQAAAALNHPHILPIHDYGQQLLPGMQSITYIVMPYIGGGSLAERIAQQSANNQLMPVKEAITFLEQAAEAIDYAHERGIVHRDIKPGNMLLRNDNWLLLADFGIARMLSSSDHLTQTGRGFGTPEYMAPEQARGKAVPASDNYSLAVIAYQLFTGRLPFSADTAYAITIQHMTMRPPSPRQFNPAISPALEQALLLGLAKQPAERPATALAFVEGLQRELAHAPFEVTLPSTSSEPDQTLPVHQPDYAVTDQNYNITEPGPTTVDGRPPQPEQPTTEAINKEDRKRAGVSRRRVLVSGGAALVLVGGGFGVWTFRDRLRDAVHITLLPGTTPIAQSHPRPSPTPDPNGPTLILQGHFKPVTSLAWSPQKNMLASVSDDASLLLWDIEQLYQQRSATTRPMPTANQTIALGTTMLLGWSPDGKMLAVANSNLEAFKNTGITIYAGDLSRPAPGYENTLVVNSLSLNGIGWMQKKYLIAVANPIDTTKNMFDLWIWDTTQPKQVATHVTLPGMLTPPSNASPPVLATSPDGSMMAFALTNGLGMGQVASANNKVQWKANAGLLTFKDPLITGINALTWSPDSKSIGALNNEGNSTIAYWNRQGSRWQSSAQVQASAALTTMAWCPSPTSSLVATGAGDGSVLLWQAGNGTQPVRTLTSGGMNTPVQTLAWSADGKWLAASYQDNFGTILVYSVPSF